jgi:hypothetical protein
MREAQEKRVARDKVKRGKQRERTENFTTHWTAQKAAYVHDALDTL